MTYEERIRERAHRIWEQEGRPHGRHHEHWQRACEEVDRENRDNKAGTGKGGRQPGASKSSGDPTAVQTAGGVDAGPGVPDAMGVDDLGHSADRLTPADNRPAGTLPKKILP